LITVKSRREKNALRPVGAVAAFISSVMLLIVASLPQAKADTASELEAAKQELAQINADVNAQLARLSDLKAESATLAEATNAAEVALADARDRLALTEGHIQEAEARYQRLVDRLQERAVSIYMDGGSATGLEFVLGSSSLAELSDRVEYSSLVVQRDVDLSNAVSNAKVVLEGVRAEQARAVADRTTAYEDLQVQLRDLQDRFAQEQAIYDDIASKRQHAEEIVSNLRQRYQDEVAAQVPPPPPTSSGTGAAPSGSNPFATCPVGDPHALTDSFGAPRYGGGYHVHAGNDIMAPEGVPIYATFPGTAYDASNSLGGLAVRVVGAQGWTYNAHMVRIGTLGSVGTGDVIGYVGATGDTSTPHDHFEWHPNEIPSSWPPSPYGYSVVGDAVNPYPLLVDVC
jgi:murein DD-endopeptidase MepM/ murein hydrolase activator NlpD